MIHMKKKMNTNKKLIKDWEERRNYAAKKFPLGFALVATGGLIMTMSGYQKLLEKVPFLANNPWISFCVGIIVLIVTGTIYKKLG